ncbi:MAG TPA: hypothetical protein GX705_06840 [Clostridiales bacterium]|nr:hypothetical protein [Clostridiales bacterium]
MSVHLGPIHYCLYNKIKIQDKITEDILLLAEDNYNSNYREYMDKEYGIIEKKPLEEIIDESNIHGWLQEGIHIVEKRLAYLLTNLLKEHAESIEQIKEIYKNTGIKEAERIQINNEFTASELYKTAVNDSLLDGMPCDHVNSVKARDDNNISWKRNSDVHEEFWQAVDGDVSNYHNLRDEYIKGFLTNTDATYENINDSSFKIFKENK